MIATTKDLVNMHNMYGVTFDFDLNTNIRYVVGKSASDNWTIHRASSQSDVVFHLDKFSSPYVIVNVPLTDLTNDQIRLAAYLCKMYSKHKAHNNLGVLYTPISNTKLAHEVGSFNIVSNKKKRIIYL